MYKTMSWLANTRTAWPQLLLRWSPPDSQQTLMLNRSFDDELHPIQDGTHYSVMITVRQEHFINNTPSIQSGVVVLANVEEMM